MRKNIKKSLHILHEESEESIVNPFEGEKAKGWEAALNALASALFNEQSAGQGQPEQESQQEMDPRLEKLPVESQSSGSSSNNEQSNSQNKDSQNAEENNSKENTDQSKQSNDSDSNDNKNSNSNSDKLKDQNDELSPQEIEDLVDRVTAARNKAEDVIDDAGNSTETNEAGDVVDELNDLENEAKEAKTESDANKIKARLDKIATFWDNEKNKKSFENDTQIRKADKKLQKELRQARLNAKKRQSEYQPMNINEIVNNIVRTIKNQTCEVRDSDWSRYNDRANDLGYIAPGRYNNEKKDIPDVVFYFDVSGSWSADRVKIDMGHRIEESLKKLDREGKIHLKCFYFGVRVHSSFTEKDGGNSDQPIPHAASLLAANELDNIIIMTDGDPQSNEVLKVPGYAWLLFYGYASESLAKNVSGKKGTKIVMIKHND